MAPHPHEGARRSGLTFVALVALVSALGAPLGTATAQPPLSPADAPSPLSPWVPWVLDGQTTYACTLVGGDRYCAWPGELSLDLGDAGGTFALDVVADREVPVPLPGNDEHFPVTVRVDGAARPVVTVEGVPSVRVGAGTHSIEGALRWRALPEILEVPATIARVALTLRGERVAWPRREDSGAVWLARGTAGEPTEGHLEMEVFRKVEDASPFRVTTHLSVRVSGEPREVQLGNVLLAGMVPTELWSELAVRLSPDGAVAAQVHAGTFSIEVTAMTDTPPETLAPPAQETPWPEIETWTWVANEMLRQVELSGAPSVDPTRTNLPESWRSSPAYLLAPDRSLHFTTTRRGEPQPPPNTLSLTRELWLDLDGEGYTVRDQISGQMTQGYRLDLAEGELGHAVVAGRDQLVTTLNDANGVELRTRSVNLRAEWRLPHATSDLPAVSWSEDVQSLGATLRLPPGFSLLAVAGVDEAPGTWIELWNLWGLFFVVLLSLAIGKVFGWRWGAVAAVMLTLCYHEDGAPLWSWVVLLAVAVLSAALRRGWLGRILRWSFWAALAVLLIVAVPFAADQLEGALFPQTREMGIVTETATMDLLTRAEPSAQPVPMDMPVAPGTPAPTGAATGVAGGEDGQMGGLGYDEGESEPALAEEEVRTRSFEQDQDLSGAFDFRGSGRGEYGPGTNTRTGWVDPNDVIQTGPGVPDWGFRTWQLEWSGPVAKGHRLTLFIVTPFMNAFLAFLRVLLLGALVLVMMRQRYREQGEGAKPSGPAARETGGTGQAAAAAAAIALAFASMLSWSSTARAQDIPDQTMLDELRNRLVRQPECAPSCIMPASLRVTVTGERVLLEAEVHASARAAYRVPGPANAWAPETVTVDGRDESGLLRLDDGFIFLRLEPGVHAVRMEGVIPGRDALTLAFGESPRTIEVSAEGWEVEGVRADGRVAESIQLRRTIRTTEGAAVEQLPLTPWLVVSRRIDVGVRWTIQTTVERITPPGQPVVVRVPVLDGESVTEEGVITERGEVVVTLGRDDTSRTWTSVMEPREQVVMTAPRGARLSETWTLACSPIWRCTPADLAPVQHHAGDQWEPTFRPWPGETLNIELVRPEAAEGQSVTIDRATLRLRPGVRMLEATLETTIRTSSGGSQVMKLPRGARVQSLVVAGESRPVQMDGDELRLTLAPGSQDLTIVWQQPRGLEAMFTAPKVELGAAAVNARVYIELPDDRWILWASGPDWGPAILFWPYLLLVLLVAGLLAWKGQTPVRFHDWALLGLGLTQIPAWAALIVVGWFFAMAYRGRSPSASAVWFDLTQIALIFYTVVTLVTLYAAVHVGLLLDPEMGIFTPGGGYHMLDWYQDRIGGTMPMPAVLSLPMWVWRVIMLAWALWLALRIIGWARWAWTSWGEGGMWKNPFPPAKKPVPAAAGVAPAAAPVPVPMPVAVAAPAPEPAPAAAPEPAPEPEPKPSDGGDEPPPSTT